MARGRILSIIIPAYNEEKTIKRVLKKIDILDLPSFKKEVIIVDDGSADKTPKIIEAFLRQKKSNIKYFRHVKNQGKGKAIKTGISRATGDYILIQDADLEYDPAYLPALLEPLGRGETDAVYGTRLDRLPDFKHSETSALFLLHYMGNRFLSLMISLLFGTWLTDIETGYKIFPRKVFNKLRIQSSGFEFEPEMTSKLLKNGYKIKEVPIKTIPRDYSQGKKLNTFRDGSKAIYAILKYRFLD